MARFDTGLDPKVFQFVSLNATIIAEEVQNFDGYLYLFVEHAQIGEVDTIDISHKNCTCAGCNNTLFQSSTLTSGGFVNYKMFSNDIFLVATSASQRNLCIHSVQLLFTLSLFFFFKFCFYYLIEFVQMTQL